MMDQSETVVVCQCQRYLCRRQGLYGASIPLSYKPIHTDFLIMFALPPRVPSQAPNGRSGT